MRKIIPECCASGLIFLLLLCLVQQSDAAVTTELSAIVSMNNSAGRGGNLLVSLRLAGGSNTLFIIDTGSEGTVLDKSLESKLGKSLGTKIISGWFGETKSVLYAAPELYLGEVRLITGKEVAIADFRRMSTITGHPIMGILGMDYLRNYCIQLDFKAGEMCLFNSNKLAIAKRGNAFPLTFKHNCPFIHHASFVSGQNDDLLIDTGCVSDGFVNKKNLGEEKQFDPMLLQQCDWSGQTYSNLFVQAGANVIGLRFLARHLVTLDFPNQTMYLKQTSESPLVEQNAETAMTFLKSLKNNGELPGWSKIEAGETAYPEVDSNSVTLCIGKVKDSSIFHYTVVRLSENDSWKLQRAWRTDQNNKMIEEFPVP